MILFDPIGLSFLYGVWHFITMSHTAVAVSYFRHLQAAIWEHFPSIYWRTSFSVGALVTNSFTIFIWKYHRFTLISEGFLISLDIESQVGSYLFIFLAFFRYYPLIFSDSHYVEESAVSYVCLLEGNIFFLLWVFLRFCFIFWHRCDFIFPVRDL